MLLKLSWQSNQLWASINIGKTYIIIGLTTGLYVCWMLKPRTWLYHFATNKALGCWIDPSKFCFVLNTDLQPIVFRWWGGGTKVHVLLESKMLYSSSITFFHEGFVASMTMRGLASLLKHMRACGFNFPILLIVCMGYVLECWVGWSFATDNQINNNVDRWHKFRRS